MNAQKEFDFSDLKESGTLSLTTYYKSGKAVATPLGYDREDGKIYVNTRTKSYKIKRIKQNPNGKIALSDYRGTIKSPYIEVKIKILWPGEDEEARRVMKYDSKFSWKFMRFMQKLKFWKEPEERVFLEITEK